MVTLKQVEAIYWVAELGSFHAAATRLGTTQSTVSKRIHEIESQFGVQLIDRRTNTAVLTLKGREVIDDFSAMLRLRQGVERRLSSDDGFQGRYRFGVTEMVALTWLPDLVTAIRRLFPRITLEPRVDLAASLRQQLARHALDLVISPTRDGDDDYRTLTLGRMDSVWLCSPRLGVAPGRLSMEQLLDLPVLTHAEGSTLHLRLLRELDRRGLDRSRLIPCNSLIGLAELARAGLGVTYLPAAYFAPYVEAGDLRRLDVGLDLAPLDYVALHRDDEISRRIASLVPPLCDFSAVSCRIERKVAGLDQGAGI